jgi:hypothetical protein
MYDVYLSHGLTKEYVRLSIEKGLMEYLDGENIQDYRQRHEFSAYPS